MKLSPLHLRLANVRRFLDKRIDKDTAQFGSEKDEAKFFNMINKQKLPLVCRRHPNGKYDVVLIEKKVKVTAKNSNKWYVLGVDFPSIANAIGWINISFPNAGMVLAIDL